MARLRTPGGSRFTTGTRSATCELPPDLEACAGGRRSTYVVESGSGIRVGVNVWSSSRPGLIRP